MLEASPLSKVLAVALVIFVAIVITWSPAEEVNHPAAVVLTTRVPTIELRYDGGSTAFEQQAAATAPVAEPTPIADEGIGPVAPASQPLVPTPEAVERQAIDLVPEVAEESVTDTPADAVPIDDVAPADVSQPVTEKLEQRIDNSRALVEDLMRAGDRALKENRLTTPANDNAFDHYSKVAEIDPGHSEAMSRIDLIADRYSALAQMALGKKDYRQARVYIRRGLAVRRNHAGLLASRKKLDEGERNVAKIQAPADPVAPAPPPKKEKIVSRKFEDTSVTSSGPAGTGNMVKDFKNVWRSVFD